MLLQCLRSRRHSRRTARCSSALRARCLRLCSIATTPASCTATSSRVHAVFWRTLEFTPESHATQGITSHKWLQTCMNAALKVHPCICQCAGNFCFDKNVNVLLTDELARVRCSMCSTCCLDCILHPHSHTDSIEMLRLDQCPAVCTSEQCNAGGLRLCERAAAVPAPDCRVWRHP